VYTDFVPAAISSLSSLDRFLYQVSAMGYTPPFKRTTLALTSTYFTIGFASGMMSATRGYGAYGDAGGCLTAMCSLWASVANIVSLIVGAILIWPLSNALRMGRRMTTLTALGLLLIAAVLATSTMSWPQEIVSKVFYGLSIGMLYVIGILWRVETTPAARRGRDIVLLWIATSAGAAIAEWIEFGFLWTNGNMAFRVPLALQLPVIIAAAILVWRADESWRFLLQDGKSDQARSILAATLFTEETAPDFQRAWAALTLQNQQVSTARTLLSSKHTTPASPKLYPYRRLLLGCLLSSMRSLSGLSAANIYLTTAIRSIVNFNVPVINAVNTINFLFAIIPYFLIDRPSYGLLSPFGRRNLLFYSAIGMFGMFLFAAIVAAATSSFDLNMWYYTNRMGSSVAGGYFALFLLANLFFFIGFRPVTDMYAAEIAASNVRTESLSIANAWSMSVEVGVAFAVGYGTELGAYFFLVWMGLNVVWIVLIFLFYPETQGRSLELMDGMFVNGLRVVAGLDRNARSGKKIGAGIAEFDGLIDRANDGLEAAELRGTMRHYNVQPPAYDK
jgi:MFS family permease